MWVKKLKRSIYWNFQLEILSNFRYSLIKTVLLLVAFIPPAFSVAIRCLFYDTNWPAVGFRYTCQVIEILNPEITEVTEILGTHSLGQGNINVQFFTTNGAALFSSFSRNLGSFFPYLVGIQLWGGRLTSISSKDLASWPELVSLLVYDNSIVMLDGDLFQHNLLLESIDVGRNYILNVGENLLSNLTKLTSDDFRINPCINTFATTPSQIQNWKI